MKIRIDAHGLRFRITSIELDTLLRGEDVGLNLETLCPKAYVIHPNLEQPGLYIYCNSMSWTIHIHPSEIALLKQGLTVHAQSAISVDIEVDLYG